jgi:hypothetical protein
MPHRGAPKDPLGGFTIRELSGILALVVVRRVVASYRSDTHRHPQRTSIYFLSNLKADRIA